MEHNLPINITRKEMRKTMNNILIDRFFSTSKSLKVEEFIQMNRELLVRLHPDFEGVIDIGNHSRYLNRSSIILLRKVKRDMNQTCDEFQFKLAQLEDWENCRDIKDELIPHIAYLPMEEEIDDNLRKILSHLLWVAKICNEIQGKVIQKYFMKMADLWIESAKFCKDIQQSGYEISQMIELPPDSANLWIGLAKIEVENGNKDKVQEIIDRTLISFAGDGFEIEPNDWYKAANQANLSVIIDAVITSTMGIKGLDENVKLSVDYMNREKRILIRKLEASPKDKLLWIRLIFHKKIDSNDLVLLLTIACESNPEDISLNDLTQAKIQWMNGKFAIAQRLFNKLKVDTKWGRLIIEEFKQFQNELHKVKADRRMRFRKSQLAKRNESSGRFGNGKSLWNSDNNYDEDYKLKDEHHDNKYEHNELDTVLKDEWMLGNHDYHDVSQVVFEKAASTESTKYAKYAVFWLLKMQIEVEKGRFDAAVATIKSAGSASMTHEERALLHNFVANFAKERGDVQKARCFSEMKILCPPKYVEAWIDLIRLQFSSHKKSKAQTLMTEAFEKFSKSDKLWAAAIDMKERSKRGNKAAEALIILQDDEDETKYVMLETAKFFVSLGKVKKSRKWFNKTVEKYPNFYDAWIYYLKLEKVWGTEKSARDVLVRFIQLKREMIPFNQSTNSHRRQIYCSHGEKWFNSENHIDYWGLTREELFLTIVDKIDVGSI